MPEVTIPQADPVPETPSIPETPTPPEIPEAPPTPTPKKKKATDKKKMAKRLIILGAAALIVGVGGFALHRFLSNDEGPGDINAVPAQLGSVQSRVSGRGTANPSKQEAISLNLSGKVQVKEVYVNVGDMVTAGQPLYTIYSQAAEEAVTAAQTALNEELAKQDQLVVHAPFSGKLIDVKDFQPGQVVSPGTEVAKLVNDQKLKLSLYFSYAYEKDIKVGQSVSVSVPAVMGVFDGTVERINKVSFISPEGADHFEAVITFKNPGTLTADMNASATLTASDGTEIFPYENGKTQYYEERTITTEATGPVVGVGNLHNYAKVSQGETLLSLGGKDLEAAIKEKQEALDTALKELEKFNAVAPIDGTVMSCNLVPGTELDIKSGEPMTVITISDNATMKVVIKVDDRNISFIKPDSTVELSDWDGNTYMGTVTNIDMGGGNNSQDQGPSGFPVTLEVDNASGSLFGGASLNYSFVTKESLDCIVVPATSIQYFSDKEGNRQSVVFVQRESRPDDVPELELPTFENGENRRFPSEEEGYYPVIVEIGLSDPQNVEIISGVEEGDNVFVNYIVTEGSGT